MRRTKFLPALYLVALTTGARAQNLINGATIYIPETVSVSVPASVINGAFLQNNGNLDVKGDWLNSDVYQGTGTITLSGTDQIVNNNDQPVARMLIQGGGTKDLQGKLMITDEINFANGLIKTGGTDSLITGSEASVKGGSQSSYVNGPFVTSGSGYRFYPVGNNGVYHPVELPDVKGIDPRIQVEVASSLPQVATDIRADLQHDVYWIRKTLDGTFTGSPVSLGYDISSFDRLRVVVAESNSLTDEFKIHVNNSFRSSNVTETKRDVTGNIFAIGLFVGDLPKAFYFSTTLSPNASSIENRTVRLFGGNITANNFFFQVFNRWGLAIFETQSFDLMTTTGWDGKQDGNFLPAGVYPYSLKYVTDAGSAEQQTGFITILR